jgi:hypothetical protein
MHLHLQAGKIVLLARLVDIERHFDERHTTGIAVELQLAHQAAKRVVLVVIGI